MNYEDYEQELEKIKEKNKEYIDAFKKWLKEKGLATKTINQHVSNADFYINDYLNYYEITKMENGCYEIDSFLGDWFIRKCMWSTASSIKTTAASIKKFYLCMNELGYIDKESYNDLCTTIKENMNEWIEQVEAYNSDDFDLWDIF